MTIFYGSRMPNFFAKFPLILLLGIPGLYCQWTPKQDAITNDLNDNTCSLEELNHSILVECDQDSVCKDNRPTGEASNQNEFAHNLMHIYSSRCGDRLKIESLEVMNLIENDFERSFNINTTLTVITDRVERLSSSQKVYGFGATLDLSDLLRSRQDGSLSRSYKPLIYDLISDAGAKISMLRLVLTNETITSPDFEQVIQVIDELLVDVGGTGRRIELILDLGSLEWSAQVEETLTKMSKNLGPIKAIGSLTLANNPKLISPQRSDIAASNVTDTSIMANTAPRVRSFSDAANFVEGKNLVNLNKLIIETDLPSPYDILEQVRQSGNFSIITVTRPRLRTSLLGDWHNAKDHAVEILNHLKHGSNGIIEPSSTLNIAPGQTSGNAHDASLYNLDPFTNGTHLRGPMFYAMSHFSRYLPQDSIPLRTDLFTQPNMFAAHYAAFLDPSDRIVTIVLNDNDHMLPFRLSVDGKIKAYTLLKPKSFNTFMLKR